MTNKLMKNLTIANIALVPIAIIFVLFSLIALDVIKIQELCYALIIGAGFIALACGVLYIIRAKLGKDGNALSQKIDARKTKIMFFVFGIIVVSFMVFIAIIAILFTAQIHNIASLIYLMAAFAIIVFIIGLTTLIIDSVVVNKWRKNKKEA